MKELSVRRFDGSVSVLTVGHLTAVFVSSCSADGLAR